VIERLLDAERAMSFGQLDLAEEIYQQVSTADPKNSIAVVGLARVTLERGDDLAAYLLARRALGIDPENDAARRMALRLEEVLATRGQPVEDPLPAEDVAQVSPPSAGGPPAGPPPAGPSPHAAAAHIPKAVPPRRKRRSLIDRLRRR
jgi:hypothetical protein